MLVKEMHLAVEQGLQKNASNQYDSFTPDEIDLALNIGQQRYIKRRVDKVLRPDQAFIDSQKARDDVRSIIEKNYRIYTQSPKPNDPFYEDNMYYGGLPENYMFLLNDRSSVKYITDDPCTTVSTTQICDHTVNKVNERNEYISVVPYVADTTDACNPNLFFQIIFNGAKTTDGTYADLVVFDLADFSTANGYKPITAFQDGNDKYKVVNLVLEHLNRFNSLSELISFAAPNAAEIEISNTQDVYFNVYWERYREQYYPSSFIVVTNQGTDITEELQVPSLPTDDTNYNDPLDPFGIEVTVRIDSVGAGDRGARFQQRTNCVDRIDNTYDPDFDAVDNGNASVTVERGVPNRLTTSEHLYRYLRHPFNKPKRQRPVSNLAGENIFVYTDGAFIIDEVFVDYIKEPRIISLNLQQSCELAEHTHTEVVDLAVEYILYAISSPRAQLKTQENALNNI